MYLIYYHILPFIVLLLNSNSGCLFVTTEFFGIDQVIKTFEPITELLPITVSPPKIDAFEYIVTSSSIVGCLFFPFKACPFLKDLAPKVTP